VTAQTQLSLSCRQSQLPLPLLRVLATTSGGTAPLTGINVQTALPFNASGTLGVNPGVWTTEEVRNAGKSVGLFGYDPRSLVYFFSFELPYGASGTAQGLMTLITGNTGGGYVQSSYTDWASCDKTANNVFIATKTLAQSGRGTQILEGQLSALATLGSGTPGPSGADLSGINILTDDTSSGTFSSWEQAWIAMRLPTCTTPARVNDDPRFILTLVIVPSTRYASDITGRASSFFAFKDLYLGQSLASSKHILAQYCDVFFTTAPKPLDVLFDVDNSGSMSSHQAAVAGLGTAIEAILQTTGIDWRIGLVTTSHYLTNSGSCITNACAEVNYCGCRYFTTNIQTVKNWLTQGQTSWVGAGSNSCGTGTEKGMYTSRIMFTDRTDASVGGRQTFMPRTSVTVAANAPNNAFRQACNALIVHLGDADDQYYSDATSASGIQEYLTFFTAIRTQFNNGLYMAGIICPTGSTCSETQRSTRVTRGVLERWPLAQIGSLQTPSQIGATINSVFNSIVATSSPYTLTQSAAIGASVQVIQDASKVLGPCNNSLFEVPRSRINGFDIEQNTVILFGGCRPNADGQALIVNYYYWVITQCGDGILQSDGVNGEQCDPGPNVAGDCCDASCRFETTPGYQCTVAGGGGCGAGNNTCQNGFCVTSTCPDYCVACGETAPNYCTVALGCVGNACGYQNRSCLPINCNKRTCIRTVPNSLIPGLMGDCVLATAEQGYICDTDYCVLDICGWCNGDNTTCLDCSGVPNGNKVIDVCGLCGGNGDTCCSCADPTFCAPFAPKTDACGVCGGNGLSCVPCAQGGQVGLDSCGVCGGDGSTCLPTFTIQVNFDAPPTPTPSCDACCQVMNSVNQTLVALGLSPSTNTLTCILKEACDVASDPICQPGKTSYTINIQQTVFEGATLTSADASNLLQTNGLISDPSRGLNLIGSNPTISVAPPPPTNLPGTTAASNAGPAPGPNPSPPGTASSPAPAPSPAGAVVVGVQFPSYANGQQLYNDPVQQQTLITQTIQELINSGQLPGTASDYTGTASFDTQTGTITISIVPTSGTYPDGTSTCTGCISGTAITPAICQSICTASVTEVQQPSSPSSSPEPTLNSDASTVALSLALALLL
jgi:hypothetical protein